MADPKQLAQLLAGDTTLEALAALCDSYSEAERLEATRMLGAKEMAKLFAVANNPQVPADLSMLVPTDAPAGAAVAWEGKNSLPAFNLFAKVFTRHGAPEGALLGYNRTSSFLTWSVGPGYFTCWVTKDHPTELLIDYTREPSAGPREWPKFVSNSHFIGRFVYYNAHDYIRPVGKHVAIGADYDATSGKQRGAYFVLARGKTDVLSTEASAGTNGQSASASGNPNPPANPNAPGAGTNVNAP
jgi:hypothetical protein